MKNRVFVAINLPENIKNKLVKYQEKWPQLPARWTKKENLHITLEFLGYLTDEEILEVCQKTKKIALEKKAFTVRLNKICYAPPGKKLPAKSITFSNSLLRSPSPLKNDRIPKMIWAVGEKIKEFNFVPHITLARIKAWQFRQMENDERPTIDEEIASPAGGLTFEVESIEIMESHLKKGGPEYLTLESIPLRKQD